MKYSEGVNPQRQKKNQYLPGTCFGKEGIIDNGYGISFWGDESVLKLDSGKDYTSL